MDKAAGIVAEQYVATYNDFESATVDLIRRMFGEFARLVRMTDEEYEEEKRRYAW